MMRVENAIRAANPKKLCTVPRSACFEIELYRDEVKLIVGSTKTPIHITWECLEGIPEFMRGQSGQVQIGATQDSHPPRGTLECYLRDCTNRRSGGYVAALLVAAKIVEAVPDQSPATIRLLPPHRA